MAQLVTTNDFEKEVLESTTPVLVDFYADWCGPCKMMGPVISQIAEDYDGELKVGKMNVDENPDIAQKYGVMSIPNFLFFKNGELVDKFVGATNKATLEEKFNALL